VGENGTEKAVDGGHDAGKNENCGEGEEGRPTGEEHKAGFTLSNPCVFGSADEGRGDK
jgi:hypothetical protein